MSAATTFATKSFSPRWQLRGRCSATRCSSFRAAPQTAESGALLLANISDANMTATLLSHVCIFDSRDARILFLTICRGVLQDDERPLRVSGIFRRLPQRMHNRPQRNSHLSRGSRAGLVASPWLGALCAAARARSAADDDVGAAAAVAFSSSRVAAQRGSAVHFSRRGPVRCAAAVASALRVLRGPGSSSTTTTTAAAAAAAAGRPPSVAVDPARRRRSRGRGAAAARVSAAAGGGRLPPAARPLAAE